MKIRPGIIPERAMTPKKWDELCRLADSGHGYRKLGKALKMKHETARDYLRLHQAGFVPSWPKPDGPNTKKITSLLQAYFMDRHITKKRTIIAYTQYAQRLGAYMDENKIKLPAITHTHILSMMQRYQTQNYRRLYLRFYKQFFYWLAYWGHIQHNPTTEISVGREERVAIKIFSDIEIKKIYAACHAPIEKILVSLYYYTGLRRTEVLNIKLEHIDLAKRLLYVPYVKGGKYLTKPMPEILISEIRDYMSKTEIRCPYLLVFQGDHRYLKKRGMHLNVNQVDNITGALFDRAFSDDPRRRSKVSIHTFRHTYVTLNSKNVATSISHRRAFIAHMGWSDEKMLDKYLHIETESEKLAMEHIDKTFGVVGDPTKTSISEGGGQNDT